MDTKKIIQELNVIFKRRGWELLPENNIHKIDSSWDGPLIPINRLYLDRKGFSYEDYLDKFSINQLDNFVVEFLIDICRKYFIKSIKFKSMEGVGDCINI